MKEYHKRSRNPVYKKKYRVTNWKEYEKSLRNRGNLTLQADIEKCLVRWDKFDSAESYGDHGAVGGFDSTTKGKSSVVPRNFRSKIEIS